jgi:hypothetical protein
MNGEQMELKSVNERYLLKICTNFSAFFCFLWVVFFIIYAFIDFNNLIGRLEKFAPDGHIENKVLAWCLLLLIPFYCVIVLTLIYKIYKAWPLISVGFLFIHSLVFGISLILHIFIYQNLEIIFGLERSEDDILEWATVILSVITAIIFFIAGVFGSRFAIIFGLAWLIFAIEEISWGQRILGIVTPDFFNKYNHQQELNIHNFLNPIINYLYLPFFLILTSLFTSFRKIGKLSKLYQLASVALLVKVSDKYFLWFYLTLCCLASPILFSLEEFLELQLSLFGFFLSSLFLKELLSEK